MNKDKVKRLAIQCGIDMEYYPAGELFAFAKALLASEQEPVAILHRKTLRVYNPRLTIHQKADVTFLQIDEQDVESELRYIALPDGDYKLYTSPQPSLEAECARYRVALEAITNIKWGSDGDCGADKIAIEALGSEVKE
jgi:hypothetical protein